MASRSLQSNDAFGGQASMFDALDEGKSCESSVAVFGQAASSGSSEIITRSYNPHKKFWQNMPKLEEEKPPKQSNQEFKFVVDMKDIRAKAIAKVNAEKTTIEVKSKAPVQTPAGPTPQAQFFSMFRPIVRLNFFGCL